MSEQKLSEKQENLKELVLQKRDEGKVVFLTHEGAMSAPLNEFIQQPVDGILYDLNRLEEVALTFMPDPKWVNDFAVALTIRALYTDKAALEAKLERMERAAINSPCRINPNEVVIHCDGCERLHEMGKQALAGAQKK